MSTALRDGVQRLEVTMRVTLAVLALASGVYTYLGVRDLLNGNATVVFFAAVIYSVAVSVGIYAFWTFLMGFMPHVRDAKSRGLLFGCMLLGSVMIMAMSAWLNASALAGAAATQQHLSIAVQNYTRDLEKAYRNGLAVQSLLPDIQMASSRFSKLAEAERAGSLTGTSGSGTVVQLLGQMSTQLAGLSQEVTQSAERQKALFEQGGKHLEKMRELVSDRGPINARTDAFGKEAMALMGTIASLQQRSVAPAVKRAADGLASGFIAPAAGGRGDLGERQNAVVGKVEAAVASQAATLSAAADKIVQLPPVESARFQPLSPAEAVWVYAADFLPSWAGAISIDLLPAVLVLILCVVHAGIRREGEPEVNSNTMTAAQLITALRLTRELDDAQGAMRQRTAHAADAPNIAPDTVAPKHAPLRIATAD
jgi:hypothetical protein